MRSCTPCPRKAQVGGSQNLVPTQWQCDFRGARRATKARRGGAWARGGGGAAWAPNPPGDADTRPSLSTAGTITADCPLTVNIPLRAFYGMKSLTSFSFPGEFIQVAVCGRAGLRRAAPGPRAGRHGSGEDGKLLPRPSRGKKSPPQGLRVRQASELQHAKQAVRVAPGRPLRLRVQPAREWGPRAHAALFGPP